MELDQVITSSCKTVLLDTEGLMIIHLSKLKPDHGHFGFHFAAPTTSTILYPTTKANQFVS